ncbi:hypothetical protein Pmani_023847 [Petrolisthes manimaculis]|uniref:Uncharacterized protein n=1 Tax=Petrolisthes manimaculis TaxID=1843537 RepID=A0AAE1P9A4_9EUCA|nr:hypothetical protein Pmani_023847 [Petrolisthes manimaculis]
MTYSSVVEGKEDSEQLAILSPVGVRGFTVQGRRWGGMCGVGRDRKVVGLNEDYYRRNGENGKKGGREEGERCRLGEKWWDEAEGERSSDGDRRQ